MPSVDDLHARLLSLPDTSYRRMMGANCFLVGGRMFAFFPSQDRVVLKLPEDGRQRFLALPGAAPFTMNQGLFGVWVQAPLSSLPGDALLAFADAAHDYVRSLPPPRAGRGRRPRRPSR